MKLHIVACKLELMTLNCKRMVADKWKCLDSHLRLRLADLEPRHFEEFFLGFLRAGISLTINRNGQGVTKHVLTADLYAAGSGREQKGIDLRVEVEGGEVWAFQCKRQNKWTPAETREAIAKAARYPAQHYFLVVACDPHEGVQDEMAKHPNWTFWNLSTICAEFKLRVPVPKQSLVLSLFLSRTEIKRFIPYATESLIPPEKYFEGSLGTDKLFRHDWKLVGREKELQELRHFLASKNAAQIVNARGGEGKSRLLWELCRTLPKEEPGVEVLCLNPHRADNDFEFAFQNDPMMRVIIVDDAHRTEQVPSVLFALVAQDAKKRSCKLILATRPQGIEALFHKFFGTGLEDKLAPQISLGPLNESQVKALAAESLGEGSQESAAELASLTDYNPFLTVVAGTLLREKRMQWRGWTNNVEFRRHVFREFEHANLESIPEPDRGAAKAFLRLLALLAPATFNPESAHAAARCLGCKSVFEFETHLSRLRQSELVVGRDEGLRIIPDLFADFLVFDACYDPTQKKPAFVQQVLREFSDCGSAILRNLSEATWVAKADNIPDNDLLKPLVEQEFRRFEAGTFYERAEVLQQWSRFSVYMPEESLGLAKLAIELKSPGDGSTVAPAFFKIPGFLDSADYVRRQLAPMLMPVAKYHKKYRHAALTLLWDLGAAMPWVPNQGHPWEAIADVIKFDHQKPIAITLDALDWLESLLQSPSALKVLESRNPVLRLFLGPCFKRLVERAWSEGRTLHIRKQPVLIENTQSIRDRAFAILEWVLEHGSWLAALDVLSALDSAVQRINTFEFQKADELAIFSELWLPQRLRALSLFERTALKHPHFVIRYEILKSFKMALMRENEAAFVREAGRVIATIPDDLPFRVAKTLSSQGSFESGSGLNVPLTPKDHRQHETMWNQFIHQTAAELATSFPAPTEFYSFLRNITDELVLAGYHPMPVMLFAAIGEVAPDLALGLASEIIGPGTDTPLSRAWPSLVENNPAANEEKQFELFRRATRSPIAGAGSAVLRALAWKARQDQPLSESGKTLLLEIAPEATEESAQNLLDLVASCSDANMPLAIRLLQTIPIQRIAPKMPGQILQALVPYHDRKTPIPPFVVRSLVMQLIDVPDLDLLHDSREWDVIIKEHPRLVFDLLLDRMERANSANPPTDYLPVPEGETRLSLPGLTNEPDYPDICRNLWEHALTTKGLQRLYWMRLLQAVALENPSMWLDRMQQEIEAATSEDALTFLAGLLKFDGSVIIFRFPDLTKAFLKKAQKLGRQELYEKIREYLYHGCGPQIRSFSNGTLDQESDYVEAQAVKAAETHATDEWLGPFYRWIAEIEHQSRLTHRMVNDAEMAASD